MMPPLVCTCDPLCDEHCDVCRNRHKLQGQAVMSYQKDGPLLSVENVMKQYNGRTVIHNVTVKIRKMVREGLHTGRVISFLGPSGCGKSTLLRLLAGLETPTQGNIYINSKRDVVKAGSVGMVMQHYPLYRNRTVLSNLVIAAKQAGSSKDAVVRAKAMLERFGLYDKIE